MGASCNVDLVQLDNLLAGIAGCKELTERCRGSFVCSSKDIEALGAWLAFGVLRSTVYRSVLGASRVRLFHTSLANDVMGLNLL